jgi:hypothetical protein
MDRFFFALIIVAAAAASVLAFFEPVRIAHARAAATPVVQLERVVVTAPREATRDVAARGAVGPADRAMQ